MGRARSPSEQHQVNKDSYQSYVRRLEATGQKFPINQNGDLNISAISKAIGCTRQVLYRKWFRTILEKDVARIGTERHKGKSHADLDAEKAKAKSKETSPLRKELDAKTQEIENLREQLSKARLRIIDLEQRNNEEKLALDEMLNTGRRFTI